jgi:hypothetical protein
LTAPHPEPSSGSSPDHGVTWAAGGLLLLALIAEFRSLIRPDTGFLLDAAGRVLDGAVIYRDVVEINPPLIIWLNMLAVAASRLSGLSDILVYRAGFTLLVFGCLVVAMMVMRRFLLPGEARPQRLLLAALLFVLFALPGRDYGEREHLVLGLVLPYVFLAAARAGGAFVTPGWGWAAGVLAGLGFALKPHFLLLWPALELVPRIRRHVPWPRILPESIAIAMVLVGYLGAIALITPQYFSLVAQLAGPYTRFLYDPFWRLLITGPGAAVTFLALLASVALRGRASHPALWDGVAVATVAAYLAGAAQQKGLDYHFYPSLGLGVVLLVLVTTDLGSPPARIAERLYRVVAAASLVTVVGAVLMRSAVGATGYDPQRSEFEARVRAVREHAGSGRVFVMSYHIGSAYPLVNYSGLRSASRFPQLWILPATYWDELHADAPLRFRNRDQMGPVERYLNDATLADFEHYQPTVLVVLRHARDLPANGMRRLDYIAYFGRDPRFAPLLRQYRWVADVGEYAVYARLPGAAPRAGRPPTATAGTQDVLGTDREGLQVRLLRPAFLAQLGLFLLAAAFFARRPGFGRPG